MTNFARGTITVSGKFKNIKNFILNGIAVIHEEGTGGYCHTVLKSPKIDENGNIINPGYVLENYFWIKDTSRHFPFFYEDFNVNACNNDEDYSYDFDIEAAWTVDVEDLAKISAKYHVNFKSDNIQRSDLKQEFEIENGEIIKNEVKYITNDKRLFSLNFNWKVLAWLQEQVNFMQSSYYIPLKDIATIEDNIQNDYIHTMKGYMSSNTSMDTDDIIYIVFNHYSKYIAQKYGYNVYKTEIDVNGINSQLWLTFDSPQGYEEYDMLDEFDVCHIMKRAKELVKENVNNG